MDVDIGIVSNTYHLASTTTSCWKCVHWVSKIASYNWTYGFKCSSSSVIYVIYDYFILFWTKQAVWEMRKRRTSHESRIGWFWSFEWRGSSLSCQVFEWALQGSATAGTPNQPFLWRLLACGCAKKTRKRGTIDVDPNHFRLRTPVPKCQNFGLDAKTTFVTWLFSKCWLKKLQKKSPEHTVCSDSKMDAVTLGRHAGLPRHFGAPQATLDDFSSRFFLGWKVVFFSKLLFERLWTFFFLNVFYFFHFLKIKFLGIQLLDVSCIKTWHPWEWFGRNDRSNPRDFKVHQTSDTQIRNILWNVLYVVGFY